jgi:hypothetical protein
MLGRLHLALRGGARPRLPIGEALHPVTLASAIVLLINDWVLKPSASAPRWLTGKLSDVAGLVVAPLVATAAVGLVLWIARRPEPGLTRRRLAVAIAGVGAAFVVVKLVPAAAEAVARAWGAIAPGARIVADPTDLVALPALAIAAWVGLQELRLVQATRAS